MVTRLTHGRPEKANTQGAKIASPFVIQSLHPLGVQTLVLPGHAYFRVILKHEEEEEEEEDEDDDDCFI